MNPCHLNLSTGSQVSGVGYVQTAQSIGQDHRVLSSLQGSAFPTASQGSFPALGHDGHGSSQAPQVPETNVAPSFRQSLKGGFNRTPSSSHPYRQARLCHVADHPSSQSQGWSQLHFPAVSASDPMASYNAVTGNCASTGYHDSRQLPLLAAKFDPPPDFGPALQCNIVTPNMNQVGPSFTAGLTVPGQTSLSTYGTSASLLPADEADIEYAQYRYGNQRCFYQCRFDLSGSPCDMWVVGDRVRVLRHLRHHHHLQMGPTAPALCRWYKCTHSRLMKQENLARHVVMHLGVKWKCPHCRRLFSRDDAVHRHVERMHPDMDVSDAEVMPGFKARAINES